ncbi:hypothetical protein SBA7_960024 [Candidatus Sulfotelmatobacter sp. SbA7]|nr:hypothetical protein SBA7_960024 [Candidatus Sulfotelmatobacter sp. SbA7]
MKKKKDWVAIRKAISEELAKHEKPKEETAKPMPPKTTEPPPPGKGNSGRPQTRKEVLKQMLQGKICSAPLRTGHKGPCLK